MHVARVRFFSLFLMFALLTTGAIFGQNSKATLGGTVKDESGALLQGARIRME